jgi:hypothetical protein
LSASYPAPHGEPKAHEPHSIEELLAILDQMVTKCEEMVDSLARGAVVTGTGPIKLRTFKSHTD